MVTLTLASTGNDTFTGATTVSGTFTLGSTGSKTFSGDVTVNSGGIWNETGIGAINDAGNLTNNGTYIANTGIHTFSVTGKSITGTVSIPNLTVANNVTLTNNGTLTVSTGPGRGERLLHPGQHRQQHA